MAGKKCPDPPRIEKRKLAPGGKKNVAMAAKKPGKGKKKVY